MAPKIHVTGAPGAGKTTIGTAIAEQCNITHIDADSIAWKITDPPYQKRIGVSHRKSILGAKLGKHDSWVLSGSIHYWGNIFFSQLDLAILVVTPTDIRMRRLYERENKIFSLRIVVGGDLYTTHKKFMRKAELYDTGDSSVRSLTRDKAWLHTLPCTSVCIDGNQPLGGILKELTPIIRNGKRGRFL